MRTLMIGVALIAVAALFRILPHPANVTPLAAMALVGGMYLDRRYALVVPALAMVISDAFIGFHATVPFVYGSFLIIGLVGLWLRSRKSVATIVGAAVFGSLFFFIVTNFGVWLTGGGWNYPRNIAGLIECYTMALPFFRATLIGDIVSVAVLAGAFEFSERLMAEPNKIRV